MIQETVDRLIAQCPSLSSVSTAEDLDALDRGTAPKNGAAFVIPFTDAGADQELMTGGSSQEIETRILVAFLVRKHDDAKGGKRAQSFDTFKTEIEAALFGWTPADALTPFELVIGRGASRGNGVTLYVQTWKTTRTLRST